MKIDDTRNHERVITFKEIRTGDTFIFEGWVLTKIGRRSGDGFFSVKESEILRIVHNKFSSPSGEDNELVPVSDTPIRHDTPVNLVNASMVIEPWPQEEEKR